ncbi:redoxin domain-containing protein [Lysobacter sp. F6437]|uniref:redoxin domain-containing protein n=1 Tax=Lysobacter sp. F6437 TaxID=3459296 RepID=UPI00403DA90D
MRHPVSITVLGSVLVAIALCACQPSDTSGSDSDTDAAAPAATTPTAPPPVAAPGPDGETAAADRPALKLPAIDGSGYDLAAHRGKWVVVNFWATWCAPCLKEMPELSALDAMHEHIEVIGLAYEDIEVEAMRAFLVEHPVVYPVAIVDTYAPPADFDTPRGLPMTYLIAPDGRVAKKVVGPVTAREIEDAIAAHGGPQADASAAAPGPA